MRIIHVAPRYYPHIGGVEYVVKNIVERLTKMGHEVTVLAGEPSIDKSTEEEINGVHVLRWPTWSPNEAYHIPRKRDELKEWLRKNAKEVDVIHFHNVHAILSIYSLNAIKDINTWKVFTPYYHGTGHTAFRKALWTIWRHTAKKALKQADVIHTVSKLESELVEKDFGIKAIVIENGVEEWIQEITWNPRNYVMYSGRIEKYKNIHRLGNIVKILNEEYGLDLELKVFGKGPYRKTLEKHLRSLNIPFSINDPQPFKEYIKNLSQAILFGLLSEKESYPQSINEANAIGVPVIIAEPWGKNFTNRTRTLVISLNENDETIAGKTIQLLIKAQSEPKPIVLSWNEVTRKYLEKLYNTKQLNAK